MPPVPGLKIIIVAILVSEGSNEIKICRKDVVASQYLVKHLGSY